jgi:dolichol-phosphate mannosyltransferase
VPEISVIIPTYKEARNIEKIVREIIEIVPDVEIVIVDDDSPDGTGKIAEDLKLKYKNIKVLHRKERGLASAVVAGFRVTDGEIIGVMDADLSHPPTMITKLIEPLKNNTADVVVGSRYVKGGKIVGWNFIRKITSRGAILLARPLTPLKDPVSGFFFLKKKVINHLDLNPSGYKIGLEIIVKGKYTSVVEIPYTFTNRKVGKSKLSLKEYLNFLEHLFKLYIFKMKRTIG